MRNSTGEKELGNQRSYGTVEVMGQWIRNATDKEALRKESETESETEVQRQSISTAADEQALGKRTKLNLKSRPSSDKAKSNI